MKHPNLPAALLIFVCLAACYLALSPGTILGMGYNGEEMLSADRMLTRADAWVRGVPIPPMVWSRHGPLPVLFDVPFVAAGKFIGTPDFMLSFEPVLVTAALAAVLFLWLSKIASPGMSLVLTLAGAFGTMLWPYAYIGLETNQTFFVFLAAYLALACGDIRGWWRLLGFAAVCGIAVSLKSTGIVLCPAIAYLVYVQFRDDWRSRRWQVAAVLLVIGLFWLASVLGRAPFWTARGGGFHALRQWIIDSPLMFFSNAIGIFGSPSKGIFVFAPVLMLSLYAVPRAFRTHRDTTIFGLLLVGGIVFELSMLKAFADEVWGSRYLHTVIAPLLVVIGAAYPRFQWRRQIPLLALAAIGLCISFLGTLYYYGVRHLATMQTGQNTAEWIVDDRTWNEVLFHARLFGIWLHGGTGPVLWTPSHVWMYEPPPNALPWKTIDLRPFSEPQSFLLRLWHAPKQGAALLLFGLYFSALLLGISLLAWIVWKTIRESRLAIPGKALPDQIPSLPALVPPYRPSDEDRNRINALSLLFPAPPVLRSPAKLHFPIVPQTKFPIVP